jgi:hypothetical protein
MCGGSSDRTPRAVASPEVTFGFELCAAILKPPLQPSALLLRLLAVGDNAAMSKPFQFSTRRMLIAVTWLCAAAWSFSALLRHLSVRDAFPFLFLYFIGFYLAGAGIGTMANKPAAFGAWAVACGLFILIFVMLYGVIVYQPF